MRAQLLLQPAEGQRRLLSTLSIRTRTGGEEGPRQKLCCGWLAGSRPRHAPKRAAVRAPDAARSPRPLEGSAEPGRARRTHGAVMLSIRKVHKRNALLCLGAACVVACMFLG